MIDPPVSMEEDMAIASRLLREIRRKRHAYLVRHTAEDPEALRPEEEKKAPEKEKEKND